MSNIVPGLLERLAERGIELSVEGDQVRCKPKAALDAALRMEISCHRQEIIERAFWISDPRPDLQEDHTLWARLLVMAYDQHGYEPQGVMPLLSGLRCYGARLRFDQAKLRLEPRIDPEGKEAGWRTEAEWEVDRQQYLLSFLTEIRSLLGTLARHTLAQAG